MRPRSIDRNACLIFGDARSPLPFSSRTEDSPSAVAIGQLSVNINNATTESERSRQLVSAMRDTKYAREQRTSKIGENRIERLFVKAHQQEEIRLSWWPEGRMANRPLDVTEADFIALLAQGIADGVLSSQFLPKLLTAAATAKASHL